MNTLRKMYKILNRSQRRSLVVMLFLMIIGAAAETVSVAGISPLVNLISNPDIIDENRYYRLLGKTLGLTGVNEYIYALIAILIVIYVVKNLFIIFEHWMQSRFSFRCRRELSTQVLDFYLHEDYLTHLTRDRAEQYRDVTTDVPQTFAAITNFLRMITEALTCAFIMIYLLISEWVITLITGALLILLSFLFIRFFKNTSVAGGKVFRKKVAEQNRLLMESLNAYQEAILSNKEDDYVERYNRSFRELDAYAIKQYLIEAIPKPVMETVSICAILLSVLIRVLIGVDLQSIVPTLSVFAVAAFRMIPSFNRVSSYYSRILYSKANIDNVDRLLNRMRAGQHRIQEAHTKEKMQINRGVFIKSLSFRYEGSDTAYLSGISLDIIKNQSVGLIGSSGSGKTTLANILLGLIAPDEGAIYADDTDIASHMRSWHNTVGYIPQSIVLLNDSIRNNVAFAVAADEIDEKKIWSALEEAQLADYVKTLKDGIDTVVGEGGMRLSGGQRQRIGIARALYRDPQFLVLDEATSALDNETEKAVMESIEHLHGTRTMLIIAHRLTTIQNCDVVYEVRDHKIVRRDKESVLQAV